MTKKFLTLIITLTVWIHASAQQSISADTLKAYEAQWVALHKSGMSDKLKNAINDAYKKNINNEEFAHFVYVRARALGLDEIKQQISDNMSLYSDKGKLAFEIRMGKIMSGNMDLVLSEAPLILKDFPEMPVSAKQMLVSGVIQIYSNNKQYDKAIAFVEQCDPKTPIYYSSIASNMINNNHEIEIALSLCKKQLEIVGNTPDEVLSALGTADKETLNIGINKIYAMGLEKAGLLDEATNIYAYIYTLKPGIDSPVKENYLDILTKTKKHAKILELVTSLAKSGYWNNKVSQALVNSLPNLVKSSKEISTIISELRNEANKKNNDLLKAESINQPAAPFQLRNTENTIFNLKDMKSKVIILDFWSTWCGPCIDSFPGLQKIYDEYKSNPNVVILAINREEPGKAEEVIKSFEQKRKKMSDFLAARKFTFLSYYDTDQLVEKYKITALPTTVFIDKKGNIRFFDKGISNESEMIQQFSKKIEFLLGDN